MVLDDPQELAALERIVHPEVRDARAAFVAAHRGAPALVFEIPLLFETGGEKQFDKVVVVSAPVEVQRERVLARPGMSAGKLASILARQVPDADQRARADFVVDTGADLSTTESQVRHIIACLGLPSNG
jgi:dephospho-CoA kinase